MELLKQKIISEIKDAMETTSHPTEEVKLKQRTYNRPWRQRFLQSLGAAGGSEGSKRSSARVARAVAALWILPCGAAA